MRLLGLNCMGIVNTEIGLNVTVAAALDNRPGHLGLASQSGTYVTQTLAYLKERGIRFSKAVSCGNEADIGIIDALEYLGADEQTKAIILIHHTSRGSATAGGSSKPPGAWKIMHKSGKGAHRAGHPDQSGPDYPLMRASSVCHPTCTPFGVAFTRFECPLHGGADDAPGVVGITDPEADPVA